MPAKTARAWTTLEVAHHANCTFRQLDYWTRNGVLMPSIAPGAGSGSARRWSDHDILLATLCARLSRLGAERDTLTLVTAELALRPTQDLEMASWVLVEKEPFRLELNGHPNGADAWIVPL